MAKVVDQYFISIQCLKLAELCLVNYLRIIGMYMCNYESSIDFNQEAYISSFVTGDGALRVCRL